MQDLFHSELLEEAHDAVSEWNGRSRSPGLRKPSAAAATAAAAAVGAKELRTPTKRLLPAQTMPPPTEDREAALRLDTVSVRWQLPADGGLVEAQHGRLTGQLRVLHDGRVAAEAPQLSSPTKSSAHRSLRFKCAGHVCCLAVRRGGQVGGYQCSYSYSEAERPPEADRPPSAHTHAHTHAHARTHTCTRGQVGGYEYELKVDGQPLEAAPQVQPPSLSTPRARLATARRTEERANELSRNMEAHLTTYHMLTTYLLRALHLLLMNNYARRISPHAATATTMTTSGTRWRRRDVSVSRLGVARRVSSHSY